MWVTTPPRPLNDASGVIYFLMTKIAFKKPPLELAEFMPLLRKRGLIIDDESELQHDLKYIGYYRLTGYMFPFQISFGGANTHNFIKDTNYKTIKDHYVFDRKLRLHSMDAIERIEIALRVAIISRMANLDKDAFWYLNEKYFWNKAEHIGFIKMLEQKIEESSELFLHHYTSKYNEKFPPAWMVFELLSFGMLSRLFQNLNEIDQKIIANEFKMQLKNFKSWLHSLTYVRNLCAHHSRLWNRKFVFPPSLTGFEKEFYISHALKQDVSSYYVRAALMQILMKKVSPSSQWGENLKNLIAEHPSVDINRLGFPAGWDKRTIWAK